MSARGADWISAAFQPSSALLYQHPVYRPAWRPMFIICPSTETRQHLLREWIGEGRWELWGDVLGRGHAPETHSHSRGENCVPKLRSLDLIKNCFSFYPEVLKGNMFSETLVWARYFKAEWKILFQLKLFTLNWDFERTFPSWKPEIKESHHLQKNFSWRIIRKYKVLV